MDSRKAILILGLLAMVLLISSEVSARDLTETKKEVVDETNEVNDAKYYHSGRNHGGGSHYGGGSHHGGGGCQYHCHGRCCSHAEFVAVQTDELNDAKYYHGSHNHGGGSHYGGGSHHGGGGCQYHCHGRCCSHAEFVAVQTDGNTHN